MLLLLLTVKMVMTTTMMVGVDVAADSAHEHGDGDRQ